MTIVARFEVGHTQFLDPAGKPTQPLPDFARDPADLVPLYRWMLLARTLDQRMLALQRTGQLGTFASGLGKEAVDVGLGSAMLPDDVLLPTYRETGVQLLRGVGIEEILRYWGGDERGSDFAVARRDFPVCITIAAHCVHAVGVAYAMKLRREPRVAVCAIGDGATSKGEFYEAMNGAGTWQLPVVFFVTNNQWAISVPRKAQSAAATLAQKAIAAGIAGEQVDGNDLIAVRDACERALGRARRGEGPTLIEALTYRLADHTTADDASRYRDPDEVNAAWAREPLHRMRAYLVAAGVWGKEAEERLARECVEQVQQAVLAYQTHAAPAVVQMFDHQYAHLPAHLAAQRAAAIEEASGHGPDHAG